MKVLVSAITLLASLNAFAVQPRFCDEIENTYREKYQELVVVQEAKLKQCEVLVENASFRCIQKTLNDFDSNVQILSERTERALKFCL